MLLVCYELAKSQEGDAPETSVSFSGIDLGLSAHLQYFHDANAGNENGLKPVSFTAELYF